MAASSARFSGMMFKSANESTNSVSVTGDPCSFVWRTREHTLLGVFSRPSTAISLQPSGTSFPLPAVSVASISGGSGLSSTQHLGGIGVASPPGHGKTACYGNS